MARDGIELRLQSKILQVARKGNDKAITVEQDGTTLELRVDECAMPS